MKLNTKPTKIWAVITVGFMATVLAAILLNLLFTIHTTGYVKKDSTDLEDPLEAWSEASYVLWTYNSTYTACRNMSTLLVEWFSDNASYVLQSANNALDGSGGLIFIKAGIYIITETITLGNNVHIMGEGRDITILHYTGSGPLFNIENKTNIRISDLTMEGD